VNDPTVLSTFSGIGGIDLGLDRAGWRVVAQAEADPYRRAVLSERFPGVPVWDDVRALQPATARSSRTGRWWRDSRSGKW
jgi:site-specific DNA-cytosine methylase